MGELDSRLLPQNILVPQSQNSIRPPGNSRSPVFEGHVLYIIYTYLDLLYTYSVLKKEPGDAFPCFARGVESNDNNTQTRAHTHTTA